MRDAVPVLKVTHHSLHIRNASDCLVLLEAVRQGVLPLITLRLGNERDQVRDGNVFVWEESQDEGGLLRWTDGRRWSQSKVCAECLIYEEKVEVTEEEKEAKAKRRAQRICDPGTNIPPPRRNGRPTKSGGLTKQTYSFVVRLPGSDESRKWHVVAYSLWSNRARLHVIEDYPALRDIRVPVGVFARSKASDSVTTYVSAHREGSHSGMWPRPDAQISPQMLRASTSQERILLQPRLPLLRPGRGDGSDIVLPPISSLPRPPPWDNYQAVPSQERGQVFQEDRRILDSFRLRL
ncbi:Gti1/Pac2 family-domain-containing protein [Mycena crocata]|nr:Gti1/Pac2 family-domain-containing protein [Mycena crocata]